MTEWGENTTKKETGPGSVISGPTGNKRNIERSIEDIFRKFESKPEVVRKRQEIIDDFPDIKIEIAENDVETSASEKDIRKPKADSGIQKPRPKKKQLKKYRPVYVAGVLLIAVAAIIIIMIKPQRPPTPVKPAGTETLQKIVQPAPKPRIQPQKEQPAQPIPADTRKSEEIHAFLMKWKTAWEHTAGKGGDSDETYQRLILK